MLSTHSTILKYLLISTVGLAINPISTMAIESRSGYQQPLSSLLVNNLSNPVIATITGKDIVHPTLSPDGKFLAYAEVLVQNKQENTAVYVLNLVTKKKVTIIDDKTAAKYKTYSSFVSSMNWSTPDRLAVTLSDGDVDSTELTYNPQTKKLISTKHIAGGEEEPAKISQREQLAKRIVEIFPRIDRAALTNSIQDYRAIILEDVVVLKGRLFDREDTIWAVNFRKKSARKFFKADHPLANADLSSINKLGENSALFTISTANSTPILFRYSNDQFQQIGTLPGMKNDQHLKVVYDSPQQTIMIGYVHASYERGNNPLYILKQGQIRKSTNFSELYDVSVSANGKRIAYCYWSKQGKRQVVVQKLA